jgi:hypothetical protein
MTTGAATHAAVVRRQGALRRRGSAAVPQTWRPPPLRLFLPRGFPSLSLGRALLPLILHSLRLHHSLQLPKLGGDGGVQTRPLRQRGGLPRGR